MTDKSQLAEIFRTGLPVVKQRDDWRAGLPHGVLGIAGALLTIALLSLAVFVIGRTLAQISYSDLAAAIGATEAHQIVGALGLTALSYAFLTGYDVVALRHIGVFVPYRVAALASFASYAISFNLGFPIVTAGAVRFWIYSRVRLTALQVATVTVFAAVTFWLGMALMIGVGLIVGANRLAELDFAPVFLHFMLGAAIVASVVFYCVWSAVERRHIRMRGIELDLPGLAPTLAQTILGAGDLCCSAGALYLLLPSGAEIQFLPFIAVYVFACLLGVISHAPGGIGVFEAVMLHAIPAASRESVLASLLLFRVIYYFLPFIVALAILGADESGRRWASLRDVVTRIMAARAE